CEQSDRAGIKRQREFSERHSQKLERGALHAYGFFKPAEPFVDEIEADMDSAITGITVRGRVLREIDGTACYLRFGKANTFRNPLLDPCQWQRQGGTLPLHATCKLRDK